METLDIIVFLVYFVMIIGYGLWIYYRKKSRSSGSKDYFLAEGSLTWWAIGASLIASNISAEQFIGMSGEGFFVGIAVAAYEWIAAIALIIVAIWFIPIYLKNKIYTMPQFLEVRYNKSVSLIMAVFWLFLYIIVNLSSILYLGALAIDTLLGGHNFHAIMITLLIMALLIGLGGMKVIGFTDVIQVAVLIIGGFATVYMALQIVDQRINGKEIGNAIAGFQTLLKEAPQHFNLILDKPSVSTTTLAMPENLQVQKYVVLPGLAMYFAGQWIVQLNYWGCNQYITQRALGADLKTARTGILFAGFLKLFMPIIVMLPGIAAYVLYSKGHLQGFNGVKDGAYSAILQFLPTGLKGLAVAALTAAIVASLAGKVNSISTIFTLDIYKKYIKSDATEIQMVRMGRWAIISAMLIALSFTWTDVLGIGGEGGFTFIQKYTGFISPGVFAMFFLGMFWKRTTGTAALVGVILGFVLSVFFNNFAVDIFGRETWLYTAFTYEKLENGVVHIITEIPFLINMAWSFFITVLIMILISMAGPKINPKAFEIDRTMFKVDPKTMVLIVITLLLLTALYVRFW
ncbi:sodium:solute symporter family transporter [Epilithonimonas lactis]|uniref:Sodium transporter n=1 Tax=Epilithonimonas lactis TaxID=421072 RepID=A0A085B6X2_9FLAO|nr:sodium/solute symporter [Epilithonimonas lactis]KFC18217.1 sodium transporter [Epilithonimonas lactis]SER08163.1 solute:Na+ symporter, SSS family [Epilithonimonas lactis]